jgi:hypothetical protein
MADALRKAEIRLDPPRIDGDRLQLSAAFGLSSEAPERLWYSVPVRCRTWLSPNADPFVIAFLFVIMHTGRPVHIRGRVSPSLLRNLDEYMAIWEMWRPEEYRRVDLTADEETELPPSSESGLAVMAFSGGLDSSCTVWRHRRGPMGRRTRNLQAAVFVHGFDIPLTDPSSYERAARRNAETLRSVGVELISVVTNYRGIHTDWRDSHGAALASCLALWAGHFDTGLIAASGPYDVPALRWGSTPVADRLLSSRGFEIVHDGADLTRLDRARILGEWPEALRNLRVCWEGNPPDVNCCTCEKCIRTVLEFRTVGLELPPCFPRDVTDAQIRQIKLHGRNAVLPLRRVVDAAHRTGLGQASWVRALEENLARYTSTDGRSSFRDWYRWARCLEPFRRLHRRFFGR